MVVFTDDEMVARIRLNPSLVIEVTESHAAGVIRPQAKYQEVSEDIMDAVAESLQPKEAEPEKAKPARKAAGETKGGTLKFNGA